MVPDKVAYTSGEKKAEILGGIMLAVFAAVIIALFALTWTLLSRREPT